MNTDLRRRIFCLLCTSEDYLDALEKISRLNLSGKDDRELVVVLLHCACQEAQRNPFYEHVALRLCEINRRHRLTFKHAVADRLREVANLSTHAINNLASFASALVQAGHIKLTFLDFVDFTALPPRLLLFLRLLFSGLLASLQHAQLTDLFVFRSAPFRQALELFLSTEFYAYFTGKSTSTAKSEQAAQSRQQLERLVHIIATLRQPPRHKKSQTRKKNHIFLGADDSDSSEGRPMR